MEQKIFWPLAKNVIRGHNKHNGFGLVRNDNKKNHQGWDLLAPMRTPCFSIADGTVESVGFHKEFGNNVCIQFDYLGVPRWAFYAHLDAYYVKHNDKVSGGQIIGKTGITGNASNLSPGEHHLHFEIRVQKVCGLGLDGRVDPKLIFNCFPIEDIVVERYNRPMGDFVYHSHM